MSSQGTAKARVNTSLINKLAYRVGYMTPTQHRRLLLTLQRERSQGFQALERLKKLPNEKLPKATVTKIPEMKNSNEYKIPQLDARSE